MNNQIHTFKILIPLIHIFITDKNVFLTGIYQIITL